MSTEEYALLGTLRRCQTCGAVVDDTDTHDEWHDDADRRLAVLEEALGTAQQASQHAAAVARRAAVRAYRADKRARYGR